MPSAPKKRFSLAEQMRNEQHLVTKSNASLTGVFSEEPVPLEVFMKDKRYLGQEDSNLSPIQYDIVRHMEQIYLPELYPFMVENFGEYWEPVRFVNLITCELGKGSGKNYSTQIAVARVAYLLLCLESPQKYFDLASNSDIHILNVAMNAPQARRAFFKPLGTLLNNSPWFKEKLRSEITDQATSIRLEKQVELISGHSAVENFEGLSPIVGILDEISGFQSDSQKAAKGIVESQRTAEAIYDIVRTSASTRFPESFKVAAISYPRYLNDPIQNLVAKGNADIAEHGDKSRHFVVGPKATWEVNPRYDKYELIEIPETDVPVPNVASILGDYRDDAVMSRAKYECKPQRAVNSFFRNEGALITALPRQKGDWQDPLTVEYYWGIDAESAKSEESAELATVPGWNVLYDFGPSLIPMEGAIYALHADLAITGDRAGISMCHVKNWERREIQQGRAEYKNYQEDDRPIVKVDFVACYEADLQAIVDGELRPREIQIRWFRNLVRELRRRGFVIGMVTLDRFQSEDTIQTLNSWGIPSERLSVDTSPVPYTTLREVIYDGRLDGYYNELLYIELEGLNKMPSGKIDHMPGSSKDLADALCGATIDAITLGGDEGVTPEPVDVDALSVFEDAPSYGDSDPFWEGLDWSTSESEILSIGL